MTKITRNKKWKVSLSVFAIVIFALTLTASAQDNKVFRVGARVEVDPQAYSLTNEHKKWHKATVTKVGPSGGGVYGYYVRIDAEGETGPQDKYVTTDAEGTMIRALKGGDTNADEPPVENTGKKAIHESADGTVLADREIIDCDFKQPTARNGSAPPPELMKKLIRCIFEKESPPESEGAQTVDIGEFQIGTPRKWIAYEDRSDGKPGTVIYPIKTTWTWKHFQRTYTTAQTKVQIFDCNVNSFSNWECSPSTLIKDGPVKSIPVN
jgi:hypothetical protein